jgi:transcriptional regulator with XRE-family HTH domain
MTESLLNVVELGEYLKRKREEEKLSIRQVASVTQISPSTLSRIENGACVPDSATLARLSAWLGIPVDRLMKGSLLSNDEMVEPVIYYPTESTPDVVEAHLRADPNLKPETAKALAELFRVAYTQFASSANTEMEAETKQTETKKVETQKRPYASRTRK